MEDKKLIIAIDGHSSSGKSTIAKDLAKKLNYLYIDTGSMYRAITYKLLINNIDLNNSKEIENLLKNTQLEFKNLNGTNYIFLDGENVESKIRDLYVSSHVSEVSTISQIRKFLVEKQREIGKKGGIVMDGRDIGSVVFPNADFKFFITADLDKRAKRRKKELEAKTGNNFDINDIKENLEKRDFIDSNREDSPLKIAENAIIIDTSDKTREEQLSEILKYIGIND
ncbi:MAG TPA: (d)CMP kinase [Bacteroidetes bacterium]|nr:(d)CMP kinase [Bacteroidota bacterium]